MQKFDVAIVGGGAAGLACAVRLSENRNLKILVIEAAERVGRKLAATGNGQGNIFNTDNSPEHYRGGNKKLIAAIACPDGRPAQALCDYLFGPIIYKIDEKTKRGYPAGLQASALVDILLRKLTARKVEVCSARVENISKGFVVDCGDRSFSADFVVLAAGGKVQKQYKTDGSAYKLAENFGHKITPLYPAIVQLKTNTEHIKTFKGLRAECDVAAQTGGKIVKACRGDVIFTDYGVSGSAVFYVSSALCASGGTLKLGFLPDVSAEVLLKTLESRKAAGVETRDLLTGIVHNSIARSIIARTGGDVTKTVGLLKNFTLEVTGTLGFDYAQVTQGGVDMRDISDGLESKLCKNLYFAGEILDVDGDCGGYNLNWAFASGVAAAESILKKCGSTT